MKNILIFGAGRSAWFTIQYLLSKAEEENWQVTIADSSQKNLEINTLGFNTAKTIVADINNKQQRTELIKGQNIVISLLPATFHNMVALDCLQENAHLITPSYLTPEIEQLHEQAKEKGLTFLNELGLDPGIDHLSAMELLNRIKNSGAEILEFSSFTGGLISKSSNTNPFNYKLSWNPYNVIRAGNLGALWFKNGSEKFVPCNRLFAEVQNINLEESGNFTGYLNRNSLPYRKLYNIEDATTFLRGTLRLPGFCPPWHVLVVLGVTNDSVILEKLQDYTLADFFNIFLPGKEKNWQHDLKQLFGNQINTNVIETLQWLGFESNEKLTIYIDDLKTATAAQVLQKILEQKWELQPNDKDRIVMVHQVKYRKSGKVFLLKSWLDIEGENANKTAMAKTVGIPLALAAELIIKNVITERGVLMPTLPQVYEPLLKALLPFGIEFKEKEELIEHES